MNRIVVNAELQAKLKSTQEPVQLCDENGQVLGVFRPAFNPDEWDLTSPFSKEELEEARKQKTGRPLRDILDDLARTHS